MLFGCANCEQSMTTKKKESSHRASVKMDFAPMPNFIRHNPGLILRKKKTKDTKDTKKTTAKRVPYIFVEFTQTAGGTADISYVIADGFSGLAGDRYSNSNNSNPSLFNTPLLFDDSLSVTGITRGASKGEVEICGTDATTTAMTHAWVSQQRNDPDKDVTWVEIR
jgi:hypothetical protein